MGKQYTTKFDPGQTVWFMKDNKAVSGVIGRVEILEVKLPQCEWANGNSVRYGFHNECKIENPIYGPNFEMMPESECFATKQELLASL